MRPLLLLTCAAALSAQTMSRPSVGIVLDAAGELQSVHGVFSNLLPQTPVWTLAGHCPPPYVAAAFSDSGGAVKTGDQVLVTDGSAGFRFALSAPVGPALFSFGDDGSPRWAYYPTTSQMEDVDSRAILDARRFGDEVLALGNTSSATMAILTRTGTELVSEVVSLPGGSVISRNAVDGAAPAAAFQGGWLVKSPGGLTWLSAQGARIATIGLAEEAQSLQPAGKDTIAINGKWLLNSRGQILQIPVSKRASARFRAK